MTLTIGVVLARTGRLTPLGEPVDYLVRTLGPQLRAGILGGQRIQLIAADSQSTVDGARLAVAELVKAGARIVVTVGGSAVLPAVVRTCESLQVPCVSSTLPWQVYRRTVGKTRYSAHFCWGLDDIAHAFAQVWPRDAVVGCLWNDGLHGTLLRDPECGFLPAVADRTLIHQPAYREGSIDFAPQVAAFAGAEVITSAASATDLANFLGQAAENGLHPRMVSASRWLTYPFWAGRHRLTGVVTVVSWSPRHHHESSVDGTSAAMLAYAYERDTGRPWLQPLGLGYAALEIAAQALVRAADPAEAGSIAYTARNLRLSTIAGRFEPADGVAPIGLATGQWQRVGERPELVVVDNTASPAVEVTGTLDLDARSPI